MTTERFDKGIFPRDHQRPDKWWSKFRNIRRKLKTVTWKQFGPPPGPGYGISAYDSLGIDVMQVSANRWVATDSWQHEAGGTTAQEALQNLDVYTNYGYSYPENY